MALHGVSSEVNLNRKHFTISLLVHCHTTLPRPPQCDFLQADIFPKDESMASWERNPGLL